MPVKSPTPDVSIPQRSLPQELLERFLSRGDEVALIDNARECESVTFKQLHDSILACAAYLQKEGLKRGDVVGLCAPSCIHFPIAMLGIIAAGGTATLCNPNYLKNEILSQFSITEPKMVFVFESALETLKAVAKDLDFIKNIFVIGQSDEFITTEEMLKAEHIKDYNPVPCNPQEDLAVLPYSSGTTGLPKGVMLTHRSLVAACAIHETLTNWKADEIFYIDRPLFHIGGFGFTLYVMFAKMKLVIDEKFEVEKMLETIERLKVTRMLAMPPALISMANTDNYPKYDVSSLHQLQCGGAGLSPVILETVQKRYKVQMSPVYGLTEFLPVSLHVNVEQSLNSVGSIVPNSSAKIIDLSSGKELDIYKDGEILVKGPQMMKGYFKNPEATLATIDRDGWMHTGDIGHLDENGMLYVVDRVKEIIKYNTKQVSPAELEAVILKHPKVADVGVVGVSDPDTGEVPKAFVVKKHESLTEDDVLKIVKSELADYKQLRGGVEFTDKIPKSLLGKIQRAELKKMAGVLK